MKILLVLLLCLCLCACSRMEDKEVLQPAVRQAEGSMKVDYVRSYDLLEAMEAADAIVWVRIGNWLGEAEGHTRFEAEVVQCFKGGLSGTIKLQQMGTSICTVKGFPLFTWGNEKLLFLEKGSGGWYMLNDDQTGMDVVEAQDGKVYAVPQFQWFLAWLEPSLPFENHADRQALRQELCHALTARDPLYNGKPEHMAYILCLEDLEKLLP